MTAFTWRERDVTPVGPRKRRTGVVLSEFERTVEKMRKTMSRRKVADRLGVSLRYIQKVDKKLTKERGNV